MRLNLDQNRARAGLPYSPAMAFEHAVADARIAQLVKDRETLSAQVREMRALIRAFPSQLVSARLDAKEGKQTPYNYGKAAKACEIRVC